MLMRHRARAGRLVRNPTLPTRKRKIEPSVTLTVAGVKPAQAGKSWRCLDSASFLACNRFSSRGIPPPLKAAARVRKRAP